MDDGSGVMIPYMTKIRQDMLTNANEGVEGVAALEEYAHVFAQHLASKKRGVDTTIPENQPFLIAVKALEEEFEAYMEKIPFSNPTALGALASQVSQFDRKLESLPEPFRKTRTRKTTMPLAQRQRVSEKAQEAVAPPPLDGGPRPQPA